MDVEEIMGMVSAAMQRAPNATMHFLSSKIRAQKKKTTIKFLETKPEEREKLISLAITAAGRERKSSRQNRKEMEKELFRRLAAKQQRIEEKERKNYENFLNNTPLENLGENFPELEEKKISEVSDILTCKAIGRKKISTMV